jgi:hypothetical protein
MKNRPEVFSGKCVEDKSGNITDYRMPISYDLKLHAKTDQVNTGKIN